MPDIDSIRPSPRVNSNSSQTRQSTSPRASTASLAAAATVNAGFHNEDSRRSSNNSNGGRGPPPQLVGERRRSSAYLTSHDPTLPGPGEFQLDRSIMNFPYRTASPQGPGSPTMAPRFRDRAPSLGELHQELEEEQEGQVNVLLEQIRHLQHRLNAAQQQARNMPLGSSTITDNITPPSERSSYYPYPGYQPPSDVHPHYAAIMPVNPRSRSLTPRTSFERSRQSSYRSRAVSGTRSPALRPTSAGLQSQGEVWSGERLTRLDDSAYYQAETQNLTRENQMLRRRITDLERQLSDANPTAINSPSVTSNLASAPPRGAYSDDPAAYHNDTLWVSQAGGEETKEEDE